MLTNTADVDDVSLANHLMKSNSDMRILSDILYSECNLTRNIPKEYYETFFRLVMQTLIFYGGS